MRIWSSVTLVWYPGVTCTQRFCAGSNFSSTKPVMSYPAKAEMSTWSNTGLMALV